jgi:hypothetical protein
VPYVPNLNLPPEDAVEFKSDAWDRPAAEAAVEVAVIDDDIQPALDRLADVVRHSLRMDEVYRLLKV